MNKELKEIYVIGAGGFGKVVLDTIKEINRIKPSYLIAGFIDDDDSMKNKIVCGTEIIGGLEYFRNEICQHKRVSAVISIANPKIKERIVKYLGGMVEWETIIHPLAYVSESAEIGSGCVVQNFCSVNSEAVLGDHCSVVCNCLIGHDVVIGGFSSFMPLSGIGGNCKISTGVFVGIGAIVLQGLSIGSDAVIGPGSLVLNSVEDGATVMGNPAKRVK